MKQHKPYRPCAKTLSFSQCFGHQTYQHVGLGLLGCMIYNRLPWPFPPAARSQTNIFGSWPIQRCTAPFAWERLGCQAAFCFCLIHNISYYINLILCNIYSFETNPTGILLCASFFRCIQCCYG